MLLIKLPVAIGVLAGIFTACSQLPQVIKVLKEKKVEDISLYMLIILFAGIGLWVYYGFLRLDWPIIITNSFSLLINGTLIVLRYKYKR